MHHAYYQRLNHGMIRRLRCATKPSPWEVPAYIYGGMINEVV